MLRTLFRKLFRQSMPVLASHEATYEHRQHPYELMQEFSDEMSWEYTILGLQRTSEVRFKVNEITTRLTVGENGQQQELTFPGAISESLFPQLLRQKVRLSIKESDFYDPSNSHPMFGGYEWHCDQHQILDILTGDLIGQQFKGRRHWLDYSSPVIKRAEDKESVCNTI